MRGAVNTMSHEKLDIAEVCWHWCLQRLLRPVKERMSTVWVFSVTQRRHLSLHTPQAAQTKASVCQMYNAAFYHCQNSPCWKALHSVGLPSGHLWNETSQRCIRVSHLHLKKMLRRRFKCPHLTHQPRLALDPYSWANTKHHSYDVVALCCINWYFRKKCNRINFWTVHVNFMAYINTCIMIFGLPV